MANKYEQIPDKEIDLHGYTTSETKEILDTLVREKKYTLVRVIVGKGNNSANGPVLPNFVRDYLTSRSIRYKPAKLQHGGSGALDVFLR
jgi:DNA-nicking Smr family endonuclease